MAELTLIVVFVLSYATMRLTFQEITMKTFDTKIYFSNAPTLRILLAQEAAVLLAGEFIFTKTGPFIKRMYGG